MSRVIAVAVLLFAVSARGVVPGPRAALRQCAETVAFDHFSPTDLIGQVVVSGHPVSPSVQATLSFPEACRLHIVGGSTITYSHDAATTSGAAARPLEAAAAFLCPLFALKNVSASDAEERLTRLAVSWGVDLSISSLNLLNGHAAVVVGARPGETSRPQIWFDASTSRPVRVIAPHDDELWDVRFDGPASIATNRVAPRVTQVWQDGRLILSLHLMAVEPVVPGAASRSEETNDEDPGE